MDKTAIKNFAIKARNTLIEDINLKTSILGIDENGISEKLPTSTNEIEYYIDDQNPITGSDIRKRQKLVNELNKRSKKNDFKTAYNDLVEEIAYTWFNRIIAIRFMEVNDYLPSRTRVLSSSSNRNEPDIMINPVELEDYLGRFSDEERSLISKAQDTEMPVDMDNLYQMLFIKQANALNKILPYLFEKTNDYAELLFTPSYHDGVIKSLIDDVSEDDFNVDVGGQVEIIGWLYQYYNDEPHDRVVNILGGAVKKADIPAATQLFTTDWVVRYMVDNSLGKYWLERNPDSNLKSELKYLLPSEIKSETNNIDIEDIKLIDNAMGSSHILVYAFDVFMKIYLEQGYSERDAAILILTKNLFGLEIDKRAYQLTYFALMMKARQFNRRLFRNEIITPNVYEFEDSDNISDELVDSLPDDVQLDTSELIELFSNAKELGSIIKIEKNYDFEKISKEVSEVKSEGLDVFGIQESKVNLLNLINIAKTMSQKYDVATTNPPYMNKMDKELKKYVKKYYADYSGDMFSIFIYLNSNLVKPGGYSAYMTPFVWMFIKTYENLRNYIVKNKEISSLIQMEYSAFEEATVPINTFVLKNVPNEEKGTYIKLSDFKGGMEVQKNKVLEAISDPNCNYVYRTNQANFEKIPGIPISYWASDSDIMIFKKNTPLSKESSVKKGMITGNNSFFLRYWYEVALSNIAFGISSLRELENREYLPINKGGKFRKWFGNHENIIKFDSKSYQMITQNNGHRASDFYLHSSITWTKITSGKISFRYSENGYINNDASMSIFNDDRYNLYTQLAILNSKVSDRFLGLLNESMNYTAGDVSRIPILKLNDSINDKVREISKRTIEISKFDWNSQENSFNYYGTPLVSFIADEKRTQVDGKLRNAFNIWKQEAQERFDQLKSNEEELNKIFIDLYGLQDELTPEVDDKDVSVRLADEVRDIKAFLSYFIGVTFGRYSLDQDGIAFAGGEWSDDKYQSYKPNEDNLIVLTDDNYFNDQRDIINRLKEFLSVTFGAYTVDENLNYIASIIGKKADSDEDSIRRYFVEDFFKDHNKIYQKRPIYWELTSGKNNGFNALMYLHRYDDNEMAMIRTNYLHPLQGLYESRLDQINKISDTETVAKEKKKLEKQVKHLSLQLEELKKYDPLIQHIANQKVELDLDDGVKVNYEKLQCGEKILTKIS
ncbi:BREX-1 system adenine-specific DNA-methyltransferase PglX [Companilactobacillus ginsenosidimutans]|uniref:site-specific DNA-methyltransferase (adenine-specific) n=1 Tax=Companilactobacillus ginsenosidimutans TaxID=1007676 RepID=A0A0H4QGW6_9LACO|nr:BREX-1 system adenine-specific DNA-methyltransferase PglX [Companilactobacillus ginsenosidimutans]AKP67177.1 restriction endonuclease subunit M [Companilactobacillus ginsenosidimutans]